jgi:hypothetical protein
VGDVCWPRTLRLDQRAPKRLPQKKTRDLGRVAGLENIDLAGQHNKPTKGGMPCMRQLIGRRPPLFKSRLHQQPKKLASEDTTQNKSDRQGRSRSEKSAKLKGELIDIQLVVLHDPDFEASGLAIILAIAIPMKDRGQCSYQSSDTIAKITGLSKTTVIRVVPMLEMKGLVSTHGGRAGSGHATHYCFNAAGAIGTLTDLNSKSKTTTRESEDISTSQITTSESAARPRALPDRPPESLQNVTPVTDAPPSPVNTTARDAAVSFPTTNTETARLKALSIELEEDQNQPTESPLEVASFARDQCNGNAGDGAPADGTHAPHLDLDDGDAEAHVTQIGNEEDDAMPIETTDWRTKKNFWGSAKRLHEGLARRSGSRLRPSRLRTGIRPRKFSTPPAP